MPDEIVYQPISRLKRAVYIVIGSASLVLGIIGAILPGMPATVFFLITIGCYARSSERLYRWLLTRVWLKGPISTAMNYRETRAVPPRIKAFAQTVAWSSVFYLAFGGRTLVAQFMGLALAASCTIAMALIKSLPDARQPRRWTRAPADIAQQLSYGAQAGLCGGAVTGLLSMLAARFVANVAKVPAQFDISAGVLRLLWALALGALLGLAYAGVRSRLPANQWRRGLIFGALSTLGVAVLIQSQPLVQSLVMSAGPAWAGVVNALLHVTGIAGGMVTSLVFGQLEKRT